ncbi:E3 ubiquitin-protein ligase TRIM39-like [Tiliqua scincoides]|uniref:E3 ubiquitin-protein ligase TRIM39-like n=1 Tax=Tiliqua scincoides TaxID=71010 RepID=UPI003461878C
MAAASSARSLLEGLSCSLCHNYFTEPVSIDCGHSFCHACIVQHWEKWETEFSCPQCGEISLKRKLTPNRELGNVAEIAKRMKTENAGLEKVCGLHQEPLQHFCQDEQKLLCVTCVESKDHDATHVLVAVEQAVQDYKEQLETQLQAWREKREMAISFHAKENDKYQNFLRKVDAEKQKIMSKFEEVQQFLKQQEKIMLDQLEEFAKEEERCVAKLSGDIFLTNTMIHELEEKSRHPEEAFLQARSQSLVSLKMTPGKIHDVEKTFSRCEVWGSQQPDVCFELEEKLHDFSKKYIILKETLREFTENLPKQLEVEWVNVTLDPDTAHSQLQVSGDRKSLKWMHTSSAVTDYPQRFRSSCCVLGCEAFSSGRHYWEVKVGSEEYWAMGVARETVKRKESNNQTPQEGIWALKKLNNLKMGNLELKCDVPKTVGIYLDYECNRVMFFDAEKEIALGSCSASFKTEKIRPFFSLDVYDFWSHWGGSHPECTLDLVMFPET